MKHRPPLNLLEPFEASARLGSFTRAAEELSVTQSAISQRVRKLEEVMGLTLFERGHRTITLTPAGRDLLNGVTVALRHLGAATQGLQSRDVRPSVRLAVDTSIAQLWLVPRLRSYLTTETAARVELAVSDDPDGATDADVAVIHGDGTWSGYEATLLFPDEIFPVCAPEYLDRHPIVGPQDLVTADLIDLDYLHWNWLNWEIWLTDMGVDATRARTLLRTNSYVAQLDAARAGLGVALGWGHLVDRDLAEGRLVKPLPDTLGTDYGYFLLQNQSANESARTLADHLKAAEPEVLTARSFPASN